MKPDSKHARPVDRLPEPYRSRLVSCLNSIAIDLGPVSEETEEAAVQNIERDLANGGRERHRKLVEAARAARKRSKIKLPIVRVANPLPPW
jgi:hypothetical protein